MENSLLDSRPLRMGPPLCPEKSGTNYPVTRRNIQEDWIAELHRCESPKTQLSVRLFRRNCTYRRKYLKFPVEVLARVTPVRNISHNSYASHSPCVIFLLVTVVAVITQGVFLHPFVISSLVALFSTANFSLASLLIRKCVWWRR